MNSHNKLTTLFTDKIRSTAITATIIAGLASSSNALAWDTAFGGATDQNLFTMEMGFSGLPRVGFHGGLGPVSIGAELAFDYAYSTPNFAFMPGLQLSMPIRVRLAKENHLTIGMHFDPGISFEFLPFTPVYIHPTLGFGLGVGYEISRVVTLGGSIEVPFGIIVSPLTLATIPILLGPTLEIHATKTLAVTVDAKFGPSVRSFGPVHFGMNIQAGIAVAF